MKTKIISTVLIIIFLLCLFLYKGKDTDEIVKDIAGQDIQPAEAIAPKQPDIPVRSRLYHVLDSLKLTNICDIDSTIGVDLKYATTDNFTGIILYQDLNEAYLQPDVAQMLAKAQQHLQKASSGLRLLVYDAARPLSVQRMMWAHVKDTPYRLYVANPDKAGLHNYGAAVDLTLADSLLQPLDMGTPFDFFGKAAGINKEAELVEQGVLTSQQVQNRILLRQVMRAAGFRTVSGEWWHFNACSLSEAKQRYALIND